MQTLLYKIIIVLGIIGFLNFSSAKAQVGGKGTYQFLHLTNSARIAGLGGTNISVYDDDMNFSYQNPALLNKKADNQIILDYVGYLAGIKYGYVAYGKSFEKYGNFSVGLNFINYGKFIAADEIGNITGEFTAAEYALNIIWSKDITDKISGGINLKPIYSHFESYTSWGIAADLGLTYHNDKKEFATSITIKNIGSQITTYTDNNYEPLAFDVQMGVSKKLAHAPFRISFTAHHLHKWNMLYEVEEKSVNLLEEASEEPEKKSLINGDAIQKALDNTFRHTIIGVEFLPLKSFYLSIAYNHQRRQEMRIAEKGGFVGFSWGFGLRLKKFGLSYARSTYHLAGSSNNFSLYLNLNSFGKRKTIVSE